MNLVEALKITGAAHPGSPVAVYLACGLEPLHLRTFLAAHLQQRLPDSQVEVHTGLFGDLAGNLHRAVERPGLLGCAVAMEWADLDPRLGYREAACWQPDRLPEILEASATALRRLEPGISAVAERFTVAISLPTLPLPSSLSGPAGEVIAFEASLRTKLWDFAARISVADRVHILQPEPAAAPPHDFRGDLLFGFPYSNAHAEALASRFARLIAPAPLKKGIITDLDNTFWKGILGDVGPEGIGWDLSGNARAHGVYQQTLDALAATGALVAVASKNDAALVCQAFERADLLMPLARLFPISVHWRPKSESVADILKTWNINADAVVFVDDNPMELAEVKAAHPAIECVQFPKDPGQLPELLERLRNWFGKRTVTQEDLLRSESIRSGAAFREAGSGENESFEAFLAQAGARLSVRLSTAAETGRPFELVNKTNQFNLNGRRWTEAEWLRYLEQPGAFMATAAYEDKFGPLGVISAALGRAEAGALTLDCWVLSCRAFARRIEHQFLRTLLDLTGADRARLLYSPTGRNGPVREFLAAFGDPVGEFEIAREAFSSSCPALHHVVDAVVAHALGVPARSL